MARKEYLFMSAAPSPMGGIRGFGKRGPLEGSGAPVFPDMFALPHPNEAFDADGGLATARSQSA